MLGIKILDSGELEVCNGKLQIGETSYQNVFLLLHTYKGEIKDNPLVGVGIGDMPNDNDKLYWQREITEQFKQNNIPSEIKQELFNLLKL